VPASGLKERMRPAVMASQVIGGRHSRDGHSSARHLETVNADADAASKALASREGTQYSLSRFLDASLMKLVYDF